jgi:hypothetical protein
LNGGAAGAGKRLADASSWLGSTVRYDVYANTGAFPGMNDRLNPSVSVEGFGTPLHLHPLGLAVFHQRELRVKLCSLRTQALTIDAALDFLLRGY